MTLEDVCDNVALGHHHFLHPVMFLDLVSSSFSDINEALFHRRRLCTIVLYIEVPVTCHPSWIKLQS